MEAGLPTISENSEGELSIEGKDQIHMKEFEKFIQNYNFYSYTMTKNERHTILALILLNGREYITVDMLKNEIGVSRNTILNDLQELKSWFEDRGMTLKAKLCLTVPVSLLLLFMFITIENTMMRMIIIIMWLAKVIVFTRMKTIKVETNREAYDGQ